MDLNLNPMPGKYGRAFFRSANTGPQRHYRGGWLDLSNPELAQVKLRRLVQESKVTHLEVTIGQDKDAVVQTIELAQPAPIALGSPAPTNSAPAPMLTPGHSHYPAPQPPHSPATPYGGQEAAPGGMTWFVMQQYEQRAAEMRDQIAELKDQLRIERDTSSKLRDELATVKVDLKLKDREHEQDLRDARAEAEANAAPKGLAGVVAGLPEGAAAPLVQGLMGMLGQFINPGGGAASAAAGNVLALPAGTSPGMYNVAVAATEIFPDEQTAGRVMVALSHIVPDPVRLNQLLQMGAPNAPNSQSFNG